MVLTFVVSAAVSVLENDWSGSESPWSTDDIKRLKKHTQDLILLYSNWMYSNEDIDVEILTLACSLQRVAEIPCNDVSGLSDGERPVSSV